MNTTYRKARAKMFVLLIKEPSRERDLSTRLWRLHTLVFNTPEFEEWFRDELAARTTAPDGDQAEALKRLLDVGPIGDGAAFESTQVDAALIKGTAMQDESIAIRVNARPAESELSDLCESVGCQGAHQVSTFH